MGGKCVPSERTIKVNPNRGKQGGIHEKESFEIANNKSDPNGRQKELIPRCPREIPTRITAEVSPQYQQKQRGIPKGNPHLNFTPKYDQSGHQRKQIPKCL